jgi:quercetin dioxygenase-like cupin family protein
MIDESRRRFVNVGAAAMLIAATRPSAAGTPDRDPDLIERTRALLDSLRAVALAPFLVNWPRSNDRRPVVPSALPVLRWLPEAKADAPAFSLELVNDLCRAAPSMAWRQTYTATQVGAAFLENYGWSEIVGLTGPLASERVACGFLLLGPETYYPRHRHEAEEVYIPLAGTASWQQGDGRWRTRPPGAVIQHASNEPHAMRTGTRTLLALYLWHSTNLHQKAQFDR